MAIDIKEYKARLYALRVECGEGWADWARRLCVEAEDSEAQLLMARGRIAELEDVLVRAVRERDASAAEAASWEEAYRELQERTDE